MFQNLEAANNIHPAARPLYEHVGIGHIDAPIIQPGAMKPDASYSLRCLQLGVMLVNGHRNHNPHGTDE